MALPLFFSSAESESPRSVHSPNTTNATAAAREIQKVGSVAPSR